MKNVNTQSYAPEVQEALNHYNSAIDGAMQAVQKLEAICITERLSAMFGVKEEDTAKLVNSDYLQTA